MLRHLDRITVAVTDPAAAIDFFALPGFDLDKDVDRKLEFLEGPEGIPVELAKWK